MKLDPAFSRAINNSMTDSKQRQVSLCIWTKHVSQFFLKRKHAICLYNCLISRALIGSFSSSIRVQMDQILSYVKLNAKRQTVNFLTNEILPTFVSSQPKSEKRC